MRVPPPHAPPHAVASYDTCGGSGGCRSFTLVGVPDPQRWHEASHPRPKPRVQHPTPQAGSLPLPQCRTSAHYDLVLFQVYCKLGEAGWFVIFRLFKSILFFVKLKFIVLFPYLLKYNNIMFYIIVFWLGCEGRRDFFFSCPSYFFPYSRFSSYLLRLFRYLISFLLFSCASVWENTRAWVPHFL